MLTLRLHLIRSRLIRVVGTGMISLWVKPAWTNLPTPPDYAYSKEGDWLTVANAVGNKSTHLFLIFMGVALVCVVFSGILRGYQAMQERQETSHFFKALGVGLICLAMGFGLLYGANLLIDAS